MTLSRENKNEIFPVKRGILHQSTAVAVITALLLTAPGLPFYQAFAGPNEEAVTGATVEAGVTGAAGLHLNGTAPGETLPGVLPQAVTVDLSGMASVNVPALNGAKGLAPASAAGQQTVLGSVSQAAPEQAAGAVIQSAAAAPQRPTNAASLSEMNRQVEAAVPDASKIPSMSDAEAFEAGEKAIEPILHQSRTGLSDLSAPQAVQGHATPQSRQAPGVHLGVLEHPGQTLGGQTFRLEAGQAMTFSVFENQIRGLNVPTIAGKAIQDSPLYYDASTKGRPSDGPLGRMERVDYVFAAAKTTPAGVYAVEFPGNFQSKNDPDYHFTFNVEVAGPKAVVVPPSAGNNVLPAAGNGGFRLGEAVKSVAVIAAGAGAAIGIQALAATMLPGVFGLVPFAAAWTLLNAVGVALYFRPWTMRMQLSKSETQGLGPAKIMADIALGAIIGAIVVSATGLGVGGLLHIHSILFNGIVDILQGSSAAGVISAAPLLGLMSMAVVGAQSFLLPFLTGKRQPSAMAMQLFPRFLWIGLSVPFALASGFSAPAKIVNYAFLAWNFSMSKPQINMALNVAFLAGAVYAGVMHLPAAVTFLVIAFAGDRAVAFTQYVVGKMAAKGDGKVAPGDTYVLDQLSTHPNTDERIRRLESGQMTDGSKDPFHYWIKTAGFVGLMGVMFVAAAQVVGWSHMWIPLAIGAAISGVAGWFSYKITIAIYGGIPFADKAKDMPRLNNIQKIVERLSAKAHLKRVPPLFFLPSDKFPGPNAFATGFDQNHAVVAVSEDCLKLMTDDEIEAVLSHELNHVAHGDIRLGAVVQALGMAINWALYNMIWLVSKGEMAVVPYVTPALVRMGLIAPAPQGPRSGDKVTDLSAKDGGKPNTTSTIRPEVFPAAGMGAASAGLGLIITPFLLKVFASVWMPMIAQLVQMMESRTREFHADEGGALLLGTGKPLAEALRKLESWHPPKLTSEQRLRLPLLFGMDSIMFVSPMEQFLGPAVPETKIDPPAPPSAPGGVSGPPLSQAPPKGPMTNSRDTDLPLTGQAGVVASVAGLGNQTPRGSLLSRVWAKVKASFQLSTDGIRNRSLWVFLAGQTAIVFGYQFQAVAQQELVRKDSTELSRLGAVSSAAKAAASFTTGPYVNRAPTKSILVWSGYARALVLGLFPYLFMVGHLSPAVIIGLLAMVGFTQTLSINVSKFAFMKLLAGDEASYNKAYGMARLVSNAASILGPALGGTLMGAAEMFIKTGYGISGGGPIFVIALYGVLMVASSLINSTLKIPNDRVPYLAASSSEPGNDGSWFAAFRRQVAEFSDGFRLIRSNRFLLRSLLLGCFDTLVMSPVIFLVIPVLAKSIAAANIAATGLFAHVPVLGWWAQAMMSKEGSYGMLLSAESVGTALSAVLLMGAPTWIAWAQRQKGNGLVGILSAPLRFIGRLTGALKGGALERQGKLAYLLDGISDLTLWGFYFSHSLMAAAGVVIAMSVLSGPTSIVWDSLVNKVLETGSGELKQNKAKVLSAMDFIQSCMTIVGMLGVGYFLNISSMALSSALLALGIIASISAVISFLEPFLVFPLTAKSKPENKK